MKTMEKNGEPPILLDCDVVIHFLKGGKIMELPQIFPSRFVMLDKVKAELHKRDSNVLAIGAFLAGAGVPVIPMPSCAETLKEYLALKKIMDDGEAACLAVAKCSKQYVASSNITQISDYCNLHGIKIYTTMDLLVEAVAKGVMTEAEADVFITEVKNKRSRLPCNTLAEYRKMKAKK
jgi:predicted nucleic acid-binding protein